MPCRGNISGMFCDSGRRCETSVSEGERAEVFGVGQATVSRSIDQIAPVVRQCIPIPARIHDRAKRPRPLRSLRRSF